MDIEAVTESMWQHTLRRSYFPAEWKGRLTIEQAYRVQLGLLDRWIARGERLAGWKVGLTAPVIQKQFGMHEPVMGFLLESGHRDGGARFRHDDLIQPGFENELCLTVGSRLEGPNVTQSAGPGRHHRGPACFRADRDSRRLPGGRDAGAHRQLPAEGVRDRPGKHPARRAGSQPARRWMSSSTVSGWTTPSAVRRPGTPSGRSPGSPRSSPSSAGESRPDTGSCRAPSRSSTRSREGTASRPASPRSARSKRSSIELTRKYLTNLAIQTT